jgi:hypothetical protein
MSGTKREDELLALALAARRRDVKASAAPSNLDHRPSVPTPEDERQSDFHKKMTPEQRALYRQFLESLD